MAEDRDLSDRRFRRRTAFFAVVAIIVVCLVGAGVTVALRYRPIALTVGPAEPVAFHADGTRAAGAVKNVPAAVMGDPATPTVTLTEPGMTVSVATMLSGHGRFSVDVLGVDSPFGARAAKVKVLMGDAHGSPADRPFRGFTLHPGDLRLLTIVLRPRICPKPYSLDSIATASAQDVTYRFLGVTHRAQISFTGAGYGLTGIASC